MMKVVLTEAVGDCSQKRKMTAKRLKRPGHRQLKSSNGDGGRAYFDRLTTFVRRGPWPLPQPIAADEVFCA
jgi:hypothetical protein